MEKNHWLFTFLAVVYTAKLYVQSPVSLFTCVLKLDISMTVTEFPQLAHTESSNTSSVRTGSVPRLTHLRDLGSQRSSEEQKQ